MTVIIYSLSGLCILLLIGKYLRVRVGLFQKIFLPSSVIAGMIGLIAVQMLLSVDDSETFKSVRSIWGQSPGFLINIVFATLFLGKKIPDMRTIWQRGGVQVIYGQMVGWGQYVIGLLLVIVLLVPVFNVNPMIAAIIPIGFEGGHGTAAGLMDTFTELGWEEGRDLALGSATVGVLFGVVIGMILINIASRKGQTQVMQDPKNLPIHVKQGLSEKGSRDTAGSLTTAVDSIEPLAFHFAIVGLAIFIGYIFLQLLIVFESAYLLPFGMPKIMARFPLFPLAMLGGVLIQKVFDKYDKRDLLDHALMMRLNGLALDFLIVSALATISLQAIWADIIPFILLMIFGVGWNVVCVLYLAPYLFWDSVFERSIADFGQSMGVTATGLILLRVVDPKSETGVLEAFGYKQLIHEPILGGGLFTGAALPFIHSSGLGPVNTLFLTAGMVVLWLIFYRLAFYKIKRSYQ